MVLKPLARALADGDRVHAVVTTTFTGPEDPEGASAPGPHGSAGLRETRESAVRRIGDAGAVTGLAAFTTAVLQLRHATRAPARDGAVAEAWPRPRDEQGGELPRRAVVDVRGESGLGAGAVLEEFVPPGRAAPSAGPAGTAWDDTVPRDELVLLSAPTPAHLAATAGRLADWLAAAVTDAGLAGHTSEGAGPQRVELADVARALRAGRAALPCRLALLVRDLPQLVAALREYATGRAPPRAPMCAAPTCARASPTR